MTPVALFTPPWRLSPEFRRFQDRSPWPVAWVFARDRLLSVKWATAVTWSMDAVGETPNIAARLQTPGRRQYGAHLGIDQASCIRSFRFPGPRLPGTQRHNRTSPRVSRALGQKCRQPVRGSAYRLSYSVHWTLERTKPAARQMAEGQRRGWPGHLSLGDSRSREIEAAPRIEIDNSARTSTSCFTIRARPITVRVRSLR